MITRETCRSCDSSNITTVLDLGEQHLSEFRADDQKPPKYPLELMLCMECKLLQLKHTAPQDELYTENYGYKSGISNTIKANLQEIVEEVKNYTWVGEGSTVVDIGANDGTLLSYYGTAPCRVGVEPINKLAQECKQHTEYLINDFWSYEAYQKAMGDKKANVITAISCFYDMEDPNRFVADLAKAIDKEGIIVIQQNYLVGMLFNNAVDNIVHEHLEYYSLFSLEPLLKRHGLEVFDLKLNDINGGSFRTLIAPIGSRTVQPTVLAIRQMERLARLDQQDVYNHFAERVTGLMQSLHNFIKTEVQKGKKVYLLGASTRGNTILQAAHLDPTLIIATSERNPEKWGKKIASVGIPIISEEEARQAKPDYFLVLPWFFKTEITVRESEFINQGGSLIFPLPELEQVGGDG